ncbi:YheC/YheD family protein [Paenibacillus sp. 481]|uniref:YheC/YheD family protein n=1 Tax=Paenibacillus sp. 481 TaxID=2835869 RepID=UPI001E2E9338|nr:YheC/YheD family protein [Paenibacillus sp. 481]UHA73165.1 YheC/YheD family protein [Paenibacillus sp. 481]
MIASKGVRAIRSKWTKTKVLVKSKELRIFVPETQLFSYSSLLAMLNKYNMVYVKPVHGTAGNGVIRAHIKQDAGKNTFHFQIGKSPRSFASYDDFFNALTASKLKREYIVQKGIKLLKLHGRSFDLRIMVQRTPQHPDWQTTGIIGRLGHPKKIVTNFHSEGKPLPIEVLLEPYIQGTRQEQYVEFLRQFGVNIAKHYQQTYPGFREIGIDVGLDSELHPWVLEVNTAPDPFIFNQLADKSMYRTVIRYARENGRYVKKKG